MLSVTLIVRVFVLAPGIVATLPQVSLCAGMVTRGAAVVNASLASIGLLNDSTTCLQAMLRRSE